MSSELKFKEQVRFLYRSLSILLVAFIFFMSLIVAYVNDPTLFEGGPEPLVAVTEPEADWELVEDGIHVRTGLVDGEGLMTVVNNCTNCHSAKLVIQNRMSAERWNATIRWMQETQNLWDLGDQQEVIVNYLVTNYPPKKKGRRMVLSDIEWYELEQ